MGKVGFILNLAALLVGCLGSLVPKFVLDGEVKKKMATSGFGLQVILGGSLCVSGTCKLYLSFGTISKKA